MKIYCKDCKYFLAEVEEYRGLAVDGSSVYQGHIPARCKASSQYKAYKDYEGIKTKYLNKNPREKNKNNDCKDFVHWKEVRWSWRDKLRIFFVRCTDEESAIWNRKNARR